MVLGKEYIFPPLRIVSKLFVCYSLVTWRVLRSFNRPKSKVVLIQSLWYTVRDNMVRIAFSPSSEI